MRRGVLLEVVLDFLIDRDALGPAGGGIGAALDVAGEEFDAGEKTADAAHVAVAVAADLVGQTVENECLFCGRAPAAGGFP